MKKTTIGLLILGGLALIFAILSPLASGFPDGLEASIEVGAEESVEVVEDTTVVDSPWPDYDFTGEGTPLSGILAGVVGILAVLGVSLLLLKLLSAGKH